MMTNDNSKAALATSASALARDEASAAKFDMLAHLQRQRDFSERTFGPGARTKGVVDHIRKELVEIEQSPADFSEWADVVILGLDGFWRAGASPQQIIDTIVAKQKKNEGRTWPDWRTADPNKAIEHDRSGESCHQCNGKGTVLFRDPEEAWDMTCGICNGSGKTTAASSAATVSDAASVRDIGSLDEVKPVVDSWIQQRGTTMDGESYVAALQLAAFVRTALATSQAATTAPSGVVPTMQQISDYLNTLDAVERGLIEREARAASSATAPLTSDSDPANEATTGNGGSL